MTGDTKIETETPIETNTSTTNIHNEETETPNQKDPQTLQTNIQMTLIQVHPLLQICT